MPDEFRGIDFSPVSFTALRSPATGEVPQGTRRRYLQDASGDLFAPGDLARTFGMDMGKARTAFRNDFRRGPHALPPLPGDRSSLATVGPPPKGGGGGSGPVFNLNFGPTPAFAPPTPTPPPYDPDWPQNPQPSGLPPVMSQRENFINGDLLARLLGIVSPQTDTGGMDIPSMLDIWRNLLQPVRQDPFIARTPPVIPPNPTY